VRTDNICEACLEECELLENGICPECQEHFDNEDAMRDEGLRQEAEYFGDEDEACED
jgi:predicted amidophosphoribosyltransferase